MKKGLIKFVVAVALIAGVTYGADMAYKLPIAEMAGRNPGG